MTIRGWMQRGGVAALEEPAEPADDWIWMADHSHQIGPEKALVDGAPELRDGAETLKSQRADTIVLGDFKHKAANVLKSVVGGDQRFAEFQTQVG